MKVCALITNLCGHALKSGTRFFLFGSIEKGFIGFLNPYPKSWGTFLASSLNGKANLDYVFGNFSYDDLKQHSETESEFHSSRIFAASACFEWKPGNQTIYFDDESEYQLSKNLCTGDKYTKDWTSLEHQMKLEALETDASYLTKVNRILEDIGNGKYYQANLLRFFKLSSNTPLTRESIIPYLVQRWAKYSGPRGSMLIDAQSWVLSFSPEAFVDAEIGADGTCSLLTYPIKGTIARGVTQKEDDLNSRKLSESKKDQAELAMIVDLMRNDMTRVVGPGKVFVDQAPMVETFRQVIHLVAKVRGKVDFSLEFAPFLRSLFPAGSITGAPKIAVMQKISEIEGASRGFFMGNAFVWKPGEYFKSSVLIRTADINCREANNTKVSYAAGSGIVVKSDPMEELQEIKVKCRVIDPKVPV